MHSKMKKQWNTIFASLTRRKESNGVVSLSYASGNKLVEQVYSSNLYSSEQ